MRAGAVALVVERPLGLGVPELLVASARAAMAPLAARFYGDPSRELQVVGVTGTNGKTTTAYLVRALLEAAGEQCGLLGTVKSVIGGQRAAGPAHDRRRRSTCRRDLRAMLDRRRPSLRDGGLLARAGARARRSRSRSPRPCSRT